MEDNLRTVLSGELRREVRLDALPSLLELEDPIALLLESLASGTGDVCDPDLLQLSVDLGKLGFVSFA